MSVLLIAEHDNSQLRPATLNAATAAAQLGEVTVLVAGRDCATVAEAASVIDGITKVLLADAEIYEHGLAENVAPLVCGLTNSVTHILAPATTMGKNLLPRIAALLDVGQISDVIEIKGQDTFVRPIYAGNALACVRTLDPVKVLSVRTTAFDAAVTRSSFAPVEKVGPGPASDRVAFVSRQLTVSERPELTAARVVVSGGRGLASQENFHLVERLADLLGGAVGASRAAVDSGYAPNDCQVGQTGKVVAPELYVAVGISGAIQHLAGMKDSKVIVAINKDDEAPIFQVADYGLVEDLFTALPQLIEEFEKGSA